MNLSSPNIHTDFDPSLESSVPTTDQSALQKMDANIDALYFLDSEYKAWAKKDLRERVGGQENDLMQKYVFYDRMAKFREDILQNVAPSKRPAVHRIIDELLNQSTHGRGREMKAESMKRIEKICREYASNKSLLRFTLERFEGAVGQKVYSVLNKDDRPKYEKYYEKVFTPEFWNLWENASITPQEFPHIRSEFLYFSPLDLQQHVTLSEVKSIPASFHRAILAEVQDTFRGVFPLAEKKKALADFKSLKPTELHDGLLKLLGLRQKQEKAQVQFLLHRSELEGYIKGEQKESAQKKLEALIKIYGEDVLKNYKGKVESLREEKSESKTPNQPQQSPDQQRAKLLQNIKHNIFTGTSTSLDLARNDARKLGSLDPLEAQRQKDRIQEKSQALKAKNESQGNSTDRKEGLGLEKQMKIKFIDGCIEHARKTKEAAAELGVPTDDPDFWSPEGCKDRVAWLQKHGKWDEYKKLNAQDKNIPSQKKGSMHYRWLDLRTGSNLTAGKAEQGLKYLERYKDSGYRIAALGAGFSVDWKSYGSPTYDPDRFIDMCNAEKARIESTK